MPRIRKDKMARSYAEPFWKIGLYIRLSREDDNEDESESVINQEKILRDFVDSYFEPGTYVIVDVFADDGLTGTDTARPNFKRLEGCIVRKEVNCMIIKSLARGFRNLADQQKFLEEFIPINGARFICTGTPFIDTYANPHSASGLEVPIRGMFNEQFAATTSEEIRKTFKMKRERGEFIGAFAPYGYKKDPNDKNSLIVDEEAAEVVKSIYHWFVNEGYSKMGIAKRLNQMGEPNPEAYKKKKGFKYNNPNSDKNDGLWSASTIARILQNEVYTGVMVQGRNRVISYKVHKQINVPEEEWFVVPNTHEAIISEDVFRQVQEQICNRRRRQKNGTTQIFSGLVKCADCGWSLAYGVNSQNKNPYAHYHCSKYGQGLRQCSMHYIRYDVLYAYVLARLQYWSMLAQKDEDNLLKRLLNASDRERNSAKKKQAAELKKAEKRKAEVDGLFAKMYEDWSAGRITEYNFNMLSEKYQNEQKELETKIRQLHETMEAAVQTAADAEKWIALMKQYVNPVELTAELLNTLIEKITVHEAVKGEDGSREQEVEIYYRFIGKID